MLAVLVTLLLTNLTLVSAQDNPCVSALNTTGGASVENGAYVFITPSSERVSKGMDLRFLCCILTDSGSGASFPSWDIQPSSNKANFIIGPKVPGHPYDDQRRVLYRTMNVTSSVGINNTEITCSSVTESRKLSSEVNILRVIGPPSPPPNARVEVTQDSLVVTWDTQFTWQGYPVIEYNVIALSSSGEQLHRQEGMNDTMVTIPVGLLSNGLQECEEIQFFVRAMNALGEGEPSIIVGGLPKENGLSLFNYTLMATALFTTDLQPNVHLSLSLPFLCPYQMLSYTFLLEGEFNGTYQTVSSIRGQLSMRNSLRELQRNVGHAIGFESAKLYSVSAVLSTDGGESISTPSVTFGTTSIRNACTTDILVYVLGAVCALLVLILLPLICLLCIRSKCCCCIKRKTARQQAMVPNPIYSGPIYDSVYDMRGRLLNSTASTPSTTAGTPDFPPPNNSLKLMENSLEAEYALPSPRQPLEPRYSSNSASVDNGDYYVKMKGKVTVADNHNGTLETVEDGPESPGVVEEESAFEEFVKVSDV